MKTIEITESTRLPLKLVFALLGVSIGGAAWLTRISFEQNAQAKQLESVEKKSVVHDSDLNEIKTGVAVIQTDVKYIREKLENKRR